MISYSDLTVLSLLPTLEWSVVSELADTVGFEIPEEGCECEE